MGDEPWDETRHFQPPLHPLAKGTPDCSLAANTFFHRRTLPIGPDTPAH